MLMMIPLPFSTMMRRYSAATSFLIRGRRMRTGGTNTGLASFMASWAAGSHKRKSNGGCADKRRYG